MAEEEIEFGNYVYFIIPEGSIVNIPNPEWNGDDPATQFNMDVVLSEDVVACIDSSEKFRAKILDKPNR